MLKNQYLLLLIRKILNAIYGVKLFTKLNIIAAFNKIKIVLGYKWKIAFIIKFGLYKSLIILFGLLGVFITFEYYINNILYNILNNYAIAYINNVLIFSGN